MSKCRVVQISTAVIVLLSSIAQGSLISFVVDAPSTWSPSGAVITQEASSMAPSTVTITAESHSVFSISSVTTNDTSFTCTSCMLELDPSEAATFVPGSGQSTDFSPAVDVDVWTMVFNAPLAVPPGEVVTLEYQINIPDPGPYTFSLTQTPIPEPATIALLGLGSLALIAGRKKA